MAFILNRRAKLRASAIPVEIPDPSKLVQKTDKATASKLGLVKIGDNVNISSGGAISVPVGSAETAGVYKVGEGLSVDDGVLSATGGGGGVTLDLLFSGNITGGADSYTLAHDYTDYDVLFVNQQSLSDYATGGWITAVATLLTGSGKYNNLGANVKVAFDPNNPGSFTTSSDTTNTVGYMLYGIKF